MSLRRLFLATLAVACSLPGVAHAELVPGGPQCDATVDIAERNMTFDIRTFNGVLTVPRHGDAKWTAVVAEAPGAYRGSIELELPPLLGWFAPTRLRSWSGVGDHRLNSGTYRLAIPDWVPGGAEFALVGGHTDDHGHCDGRLRLMVDGSPGLLPMLLGLGLTASSAVGLWAFSAFPQARGVARWRRVTRFVGGGVTGILLCASVGLNLFVFGLVPLGSWVHTALVAAGAVGGVWAGAQRQ